MERPRPTIDWIMACFGGAVVAYCVVLLAVVTTTPDLRLRFLMTDDAADLKPFSRGEGGIVIRQTPGLRVSASSAVPQRGDLLLRIGRDKVDTHFDYSRVALRLRGAELPPGGVISAGEDPLNHDLPPLVQETTGQRWVTIEFQRPGQPTSELAAVAIQAVPLSEIGPTFLWFLLELGILLVGALAFWNRPFDDAASLFFLMCSVTIAAYVGGFHWSAISGSAWLSRPFVLCCILVPTIMLHFFLVYPRPKPFLQSYGHWVLAALYAPPMLAIASYLVGDLFLRWLLTWEPGPVRTNELRRMLMWFREGILFYLGVAGLYFAATVATLVYSVRTTRNPIERNQLRPIFIAGLLATGCIVYSLLLAYVYRESFVLGGARWPMFVASLMFMLAYAVGMVRYKLMLLDQIISRGMWYYLFSFGSTMLVAFSIASGSLGMAYWQASPSAVQAFFVATTTTMSICLMLWLRDSWQRLVDRRFFREKYQLDKALQRMNSALGPLTDIELLSQRLVLACREVLQSDRVALYLRDAGTNVIRLTSVEGKASGLPLSVNVPADALEQLRSDVTLLRVAPETRDELSASQKLVRQLRADVLHCLESEGEWTGLVVLGSKQGGGLYTAEDVTFLAALGQITGVALHCARAQQEIGQLNEELRLSAERLSQQRTQIAMLQAEVASGMVDPVVRPVTEFHRGAIRGNSPALSQVLETVRKAANSDTSVLIRGESGTGKELLAQAIHENSARRAGPLVCVHCGALASGVLESELFGHMKGAFTGATTDRPGRFELAHGGSIFLDEIGDISLETQIKLLRVLQQRSFERVGGAETVAVDVRIMAATHQNLEQLISEGKFREDLYYRLNVISVTLPPLRERRDDVMELAVHFLKRVAGRLGRPQLQFDDQALSSLLAYPWPGNIRQLENVIERSAVLCDGNVIRRSDLPPEVALLQVVQARAGSRSGQVRSDVGLLTEETNRRMQRNTPPEGIIDPELLSEHDQRQQLLGALRACKGNKAEAARLLGLPRSTFFSKLKKFSITEA